MSSWKLIDVRNMISYSPLYQVLITVGGTAIEKGVNYYMDIVINKYMCKGEKVNEPTRD